MRMRTQKFGHVQGDALKTYPVSWFTTITTILKYLIAIVLLLAMPTYPIHGYGTQITCQKYLILVVNKVIANTRSDWLTDRVTTNCSSPEIQELRYYRHFSAASSLWRYNICIFQFVQANIHKIDFFIFSFCFKTAPSNPTCSININWWCSWHLHVLGLIIWLNLMSF